MLFKCSITPQEPWSVSRLCLESGWITNACFVCHCVQVAQHLASTCRRRALQCGQEGSHNRGKVSQSIWWEASVKNSWSVSRETFLEDLVKSFAAEFRITWECLVKAGEKVGCYWHAAWIETSSQRTRWHTDTGIRLYIDKMSDLCNVRLTIAALGSSIALFLL